MRNPKSPSTTSKNSGASIISQTAQYALRVAAELALRDRTTPVRATDLQKETGVPPHYLSKVLRRLVEHGLLLSQRGHGGGFVLARPPRRITVAQVLAAVDAMPEEGSCAFGWGRCNAAQPCPLHHTWQTLNEKFLEWARSATFAESVAQSGG